ncbi:hypothetical protein SeMB42_g06535 [Synchytrium endobioticum]|uniref:Fungal lipase-type domain-containing protein n=1 Tax=Synchytrium endobioticum TaxID=286115 RepID=A0A507CI76_9FUNG|nr:hypothetical protein SeMB42_g06535 [Synchytrium endobioticum]TPX39218.1 hypothetical protein SeLEV6574_g07370 [Synchytrium endobioticum]
MFWFSSSSHATPRWNAPRRAVVNFLPPQITRAKEYFSFRRLPANTNMASTAARLPGPDAASSGIVGAVAGFGEINPAAGCVNDWTNWPRFFAKMNQYAWITLDTILWSIISVTTLIFMDFAGVAFYFFVEPFFKLICPFMSAPFKIQRGAQSFSFPPSMVSSGTPDFFPQYTRHLESSGVWDSLGQKLADSKTHQEPTWDVDVARFMLHMSALAYEHPDVVANFATQWKLETVRILRRNFACHVYYSTQYSFVVVSFKGTSPFDLSEWLTDVMMLKVRPDGGVIPGQIHEGFYNSFQWDSPSAGEEEWTRRHQCEVDAIFNLLKTTVFPKVPKVSDSKNINFWITGHSLGAALATVFLSHVTYLATSPFSNNVKVRGAYTFGSPRVGDSTFASMTNASLSAAKASCFRVVNANDAVAALPLSSTIPIAPHKHLLLLSHDKAPNMVTDFEHVGTPVTVGYDHVIRINVDRTWTSMGKNTIRYLLECPRFYYNVIRGRETLSALINRTCQVFPYDHTPSEYDRHLCPISK